MTASLSLVTRSVLKSSVRGPNRSGNQTVPEKPRKLILELNQRALKEAVSCSVRSTSTSPKKANSSLLRT